jgi:hypothetical protein
LGRVSKWMQKWHEMGILRFRSSDSFSFFYICAHIY